MREICFGEQSASSSNQARHYLANTPTPRREKVREASRSNCGPNVASEFVERSSQKASHQQE